MKQKAVSLVLLTTLVLSLCSCGPTIPPKLGHYTGTNPDITFDVTPLGIENFSATITYSGGTGGVQLSTSCNYKDPNPISLTSNGSFSYKMNFDNPTKTSVNITGKINGDKADGNYSDSFCAHGNLAKGKWSASWISP
jgi:uncharacterized lipoprotein YehR (DUF1307 family)